MEEEEIIDAVRVNDDCMSLEDDKFGDEQSLADWLSSHGIDTTSWGQGNTKTVNELWHELKERETQLVLLPVCRLVEVVQVFICRNGYVLVEAKQELRNGRLRRRNLLPSEKVKAGEDYQTAAFRCLHEELRINSDQVVVLPDSHIEHQEESNSLSYPGLPTKYTFHRLSLQVPALPPHSFWRDNLTSSQSDPVLRHYWEWRAVDDIQNIATRLTRS